MALGAIAALKAAGLKPGEDVIVVSVDGSKAAMEAIKAGELYTTVSCSPFFGDIVIDTIKKIEAGEQIPTSITNKDTVFDISNADPALGF
jgi:ABC-type sugar transport system substrate-binding protein